MKKSSLIGAGLILAATIIWGIAFVAQTSASDSVGAFTFNAARALIAAVLLTAIVAVKESAVKRRARNASQQSGAIYNKPARIKRLKKSFVAGALGGAALFAAVNFQQFGIEKYPADTSSSGRAGFLTATYVVFVAAYVAIRHKKIHPFTALSCVGCLGGMYLLCVHGGVKKIYLGDVLEILGALCFAVQILIIDKFSDTDGVAFSCAQFWVVTVLSVIGAAIFETVSLAALKEAWLPIAYAGVMSSTVGYTFQVLGQKSVKPAVASVIMSLESVFAALAGWVILKETLSAVELCGCALVFLSVVVSQLAPSEELKNENKTERS